MSCHTCRVLLPSQPCCPTTAGYARPEDAHVDAGSILRARGGWRLAVTPAARTWRDGAANLLIHLAGRGGR